jgi:hypothetical protein
MTLHIPGPVSIHWSFGVSPPLQATNMPPRDPDDDDADEEEHESDEDLEPAEIREPDE